MLTVIEKVIALQNVDVFSEVSTEQLSHLAVIAEEITCEADETLYQESDPPDAMYLVLEGRVRMHRNGIDVTIAESGDVFGTWALFDDEPMVATATPMEFTRLLRIDKDNFIDLLGEYVQITQGVLKAMVKRLRGLVGRVRSVGQGG
ncbi:MAG: cyclic nucleotide-binding domain-containing protein [bacterium]|nr:cyclic nucleotide-binding domain-containing protein [bacterium]